MELMCELYDAQTACGRYFVHELTSGVNSRMKCVTKIMAMPGMRAIVADLCVFGLAACDEELSGFVNASVRTVTNARQVGVQLRRTCTGTHRHVRVGANNTSVKMEQTGTWLHQVARAMEEELKEDQQELKTRRTEEERKICREDTRDCS